MTDRLLVAIAAYCHIWYVSDLVVEVYCSYSTEEKISIKMSLDIKIDTNSRLGDYLIVARDLEAQSVYYLFAPISKCTSTIRDHVCSQLLLRE